MDIFSHIQTVLDELEKLPSVPMPLIIGVSEALSAALQMDRELTRLRERQMAKQQIKTKAEVTNSVIVGAKEIEDMIRARYPHIPADIAPPTCGFPGCPTLGCQPVPEGPAADPDQRIEVVEPEVLEPQMHTYLPRPAERLGNTEFEDGF